MVTFSVFSAPGLNEPAPVDGSQILLNIVGFATAKGLGMIWQDFATTAGQSYDVSFWFGRSNNSTAKDFVGVNASIFDVGEVSGLTTLATAFSGNAPATGEVGNLTQVSFQFTATGSIARILLADQTAAFSGSSLQLDAVSVSALAVPEPSSFAALAGFASLGLVATRRRRA